MHFLMSCSKYDKNRQDLFSIVGMTCINFEVFSYAELLFLKLFSAAFHVVILQRDTKGWYSRKCIIIKRTLLLVSSAEEQDEIESKDYRSLSKY
jgi:hypothetical protein